MPAAEYELFFDESVVDLPVVETVPDTADLRKQRGAFFTPETLVHFMVSWAIRSPADRVLEPSCGDARFLRAAAERLRELGQLFPQLHGVDLHAPSIHRAEESLDAIGVTADLSVGDFFMREASGTMDAVVGNPPYVRYQSFAGDSREIGLNAARKQGVRLSQLANIWAAFVVHSAQMLKPNGRLALVLPAALLHVNYAAPVRKFLQERFASIRLVMFRERVFPGVLEEVVLLLAEGTGPAQALEVARLPNARALAEQFSPARMKFGDLLGGGLKWTPALLESADIKCFQESLVRAEFETLADWGTLELGMVTGNNKFFTLTATQVTELGLPAEDLLRVSPAGSRHLRGIEFSERCWAGLRTEGRRCYLFYPGAEPSSAALDYVTLGEKRGVDRAYKCRVRSPWWRVPLVPVPDLIFKYMSGDGPRLVANTAGALVLNSVHGVRLRDERRAAGLDTLPTAMLNSLTLLGAELVGRSYGGGILKLEPREARRIPLPGDDAVASWRAPLEALKSQLGRLLRRGDLEAIVRMVDEHLLVRHLSLPRADVKALRRAWLDLKSRRAARGSST